VLAHVAMHRIAVCTTHVMAMATSPAAFPLRPILAISSYLIMHYHIIVTISE
jgi:hypothetical protein